MTLALARLNNLEKSTFEDTRAVQRPPSAAEIRSSRARTAFESATPPPPPLPVRNKDAFRRRPDTKLRVAALAAGTENPQNRGSNTKARFNPARPPRKSALSRFAAGLNRPGPPCRPLPQASPSCMSRALNTCGHPGEAGGTQPFRRGHMPGPDDPSQRDVRPARRNRAAGQ